jgi:hypothetical protein
MLGVQRAGLASGAAVSREVQHSAERIHAVGAVQCDELVTKSVEHGARIAKPAPTDQSFLERRLEEGVAAGLRLHLPDGWRVAARQALPRVRLPGWDPQPGSLDLAALDVGDNLRLAFELKVDDIG